jgi:hypothetical protein
MHIRGCSTRNRDGIKADKGFRLGHLHQLLFSFSLVRNPVGKSRKTPQGLKIAYCLLPLSAGEISVLVESAAVYASGSQLALMDLVHFYLRVTTLTCLGIEAR